MGSTLLTQNPFAVLTIIVAPALLTNASCLLALSTINRLLRTRDSMRELLKESESAVQPHRENHNSKEPVFTGGKSGLP